MRATFYGSSDDLVETTLGDRAEEFYVNEQQCYAGCIDLVGATGVTLLKVHAIYDGCWTFAPGLEDEDAGWPEGVTFALGLASDNGYSAHLTIDGLPEGTTFQERHTHSWRR